MFYQLEIGANKYLCYIDIGNIVFNEVGKAKRYISAKKLKIWKETLEDVLQLRGADNMEKCGYNLIQNDRVNLK